MRLRTRLDRYPAKMVSKLADRLIDRYALNARRIIDPFCGSGAVLVAARRKGIPVSGIDINPIAALFYGAKLQGFDAAIAHRQANAWIKGAQCSQDRLTVKWEAKDYWFTPRVLDKFERLRFVGRGMRLKESPEGLALLLCYSLAVRLCSRADQRSPKPFISKTAKRSRAGRHFDPFREILSLLGELSNLYGRRQRVDGSSFRLADICAPSAPRHLGLHSHAITSPPYINAQDYFRNFKLELYLLEQLLPFRAESLRTRFVGTERGDLLSDVQDCVIRDNLRFLPRLHELKRRNARLAEVVHRYLSDMGRAFDVVRESLEPHGIFVMVCGDNLVGGLQIRTWKVLHRMLETRGFCMFDRFADQIGDRLLAPKRSGHKGLIKEEVISAYRLS